MTVFLSREALLALEPDTRAFTLVGAFMGYFALLEEGVNKSLAEVLELKGARTAIVTRNMTFDEKIKTLRSLVDFFILDKDERKRFDSLAVRARKCSEIRNIVAHTPFRGSLTSDGVEFFPISATSTLKFPEMDWPIDECLRQLQNIEAIDDGLRSAQSTMSLQRVVLALSQPGAASKVGGLFSLGAAILEREGTDSQDHPIDDAGN